MINGSWAMMKDITEASPRLPAWQRLENILRLCVPHFVMAVLFALSVTPLFAPGFGGIKPFFVLMGIYYWAIYRPTLTPTVYVFGLGVMMDSATGLPLGWHAALYLSAHAIVRTQRRYLAGQSYPVVWTGFAVIAGLYAAMFWALSCLYALHLVPVMPMLGHLTISLLIFPFVLMLLILAHRMLPHGI